MATTIKGRVYVVTPIEANEYNGKTYYSRKLTLNVKRYNPDTGELMRESYPTFEINGENLCRQVDSLHGGELVEVSYSLQGVKYEKDGETRFFNKVSGYKVEMVGAEQAQYATTSTTSAPYPNASGAPVDSSPMPTPDDLPW